MAQNPLTRREILQRGTAVAGAAAATTLCGGCALFNKNDEDVVVQPNKDSFTLSLTKFPQLAQPEGFVAVEARDGDERIVVLRTKEGTPVALSMVCTHWGCDVDYDKGEGLFVCPCHGSRFDTTGRVIEGPADDPLRRFDLTEVDGEIRVALGKPTP